MNIYRENEVTSTREVRKYKGDRKIEWRLILITNIRQSDFFSLNATEIFLGFYIF